MTNKQIEADFYFNEYHGLAVGIKLIKLQVSNVYAKLKLLYICSHKEIVDLNNNSDGLDKVHTISNVALEEQEEFFDAMEDVSNVEEGNDLGLANSEEEEEFFGVVSKQDWLIKQIAAFKDPLSIFHCKDYNSEFFTSSYLAVERNIERDKQSLPREENIKFSSVSFNAPLYCFYCTGVSHIQ